MQNEHLMRLETLELASNYKAHLTWDFLAFD